MADISIVNGGYNADKPTYNWGGTILYHGFCEISQDFVVPFHGVEKPAPGGASAGRQTAGERTNKPFGNQNVASENLRYK